MILRTILIFKSCQWRNLRSNFSNRVILVCIVGMLRGITCRLVFDTTKWFTLNNSPSQDNGTSDDLDPSIYRMSSALYGTIHYLHYLQMLYISKYEWKSRRSCYRWPSKYIWCCQTKIILSKTFFQRFHILKLLRINLRKLNYQNWLSDCQNIRKKTTSLLLDVTHWSEKMFIRSASS